MKSFIVGTELKSNFFKKVIVKEKLGEGGQGIVYKVDYDGKPMALKWYFTEKIKNAIFFKENLRNNIAKGLPNNSFLWPIDLVEDDNNSFGYIMNLRTDGYNELSDFLVKKARFYNNISLINAAIAICCAFRDLHLKGLAYQDLNDGNFFIDGVTGKVLICDNDNVAGDGINTGILGKNRYMAPEVVLGKTNPNTQSDKFSLAVVLFLLLFRGHPLEGKLTLIPFVSEKHERIFYGENPIFVCDPIDHSNELKIGVHDNVIRTWDFYPEILKNMFLRAFSKETIIMPSKRIIEREWIDLFIKIRDSIINCPYCNDEFFLSFSDNAILCNSCKKSFYLPGKIICGDYTIPLLAGKKIYKCHIEGIGNSQVDCFKTIGEVIIGKNKTSDKPSVIGIRNISDSCWKTNSDRHPNISSNEVIRVTRGLEIYFENDCLAKIV